MDWFSAFLGTLFLRTVVGGSALLTMFYVWNGLYPFAAALLLPLAGALLWMFSDLRESSVDTHEWDE